MMKKIIAFMLAGMLALGSATVDAAQFSDGAGSYSENYFDGGLRYIWPAGVSETAVEMNKNTDVDVNESVITGLEKPLIFYPEIYYDFKVTGAGTQNASPVSGDMRWVPVYWSQSPEPEENGIFRLWKIGTAKGVYTDKKLTFNLYVFFQKEMNDGTEWKITDTVESVRYQFSAAPLLKETASGYLSGGLYYKVSGKKEVCVTGCTADMSAVQIPSAVNINGTSYKVTSVGAKAFSGNKKIIGVTLGDNVAYIDKQAFYQCANLKTVRFGRKVAKIGSSAFAKCGKLNSFTLPAGLTRIDTKAFYQCAAVKTVKINSTALKYVGQKALAVNRTVKLKLPKKLYSKYQKLIKAGGVYTKTKFVKF